MSSEGDLAAGASAEAPAARGLLRYPGTLSAVACLVVLTTVYWTTGALFPTELPEYAHSARQITGMVLMLILLPAYLLAAGFAARRRSLALVAQLRPWLPDPAEAEVASAAIRGALRRSWVAGSLVGIAMGLANTQPVYALTRSATPLVDGTISLGQLFLWLLIGLLLGMRIVSARAFRRLGEVVEFDLFRIDRLRPLARSGVLDVLLIAGAFAISPLQSLDAEFRWYNYSFAVLISATAAPFLLLWPLRGVHARILAEKARLLSDVDALIGAAERTPTEASVARLESLLAHRDRLRNQPTWPLGTALVSRVFLYLVIPPLAWVGAALVEMFLDRVIAS